MTKKPKLTLIDRRSIYLKPDWQLREKERPAYVAWGLIAAFAIYVSVHFVAFLAR